MVARAGSSAGLGHLGRSSAVARALELAGLEVSCIGIGLDRPLRLDEISWSADGLASPPTADLVVADGYDFAPPVLERLDGAPVLAWMHPPPAAMPSRDLVVDVPGRSGRIAGLKFACLRPSYWSRSEAREVGPVRRLLVSTGGADIAMPVGRLASELVAAIDDPGVEIRCVVGPFSDSVLPEAVTELRSPPSLSGELAAADLVICAAGQTMFEALATGVPTIGLVLADNQARQAKLVEEAQAAEILEGTDQLPRVVGEMIEDEALRRRLATAARETIDGLGAIRVAFKLVEALRPAVR